MSPENLNTEPVDQNLSPEEVEAQAEQQKHDEKVNAVVDYLAAFDELEDQFHAGGQPEDVLGALEETRDKMGAGVDALEGVDRQSAAAKLKQLQGYFAAEAALDSAFHAGAPEEEQGRLEEARDAARHDFGDGLDVLIGAKAKADALIAAQNALDSAFHTGASEEELGKLEEARDEAKHKYVEIGGDPDTPWGTEGSKDEYRFLAEVYVGESEAKAEYINENPDVVQEVGRSTIELQDVLNDAEEQKDPASRWADDVNSVEYDGSRTPDEWREAYPQREDETDEEYYDRLNDMLLTEYVLADDGENERRELNPTSREKYEAMVRRRLESGDLTQEEADRMLGLAQEREDNENSRRAFEEAQDAERDSLVRRVNANDPDALEFLEKHPELKDDILHRVADLNGRDFDEMMAGDGQAQEGQDGQGQGQQTTAEETTGDENTADETTDEENTTDKTTGEENTADETTGEENPDNRGRVVEGGDQPNGPERRPLIAVNLDLEKDARDAAHSIAEKWFEEKRAGRKGIFRKLVLGVTDNLFREAKIKRYEDQAYDAIIAKQEGRESRVTDQDWAANKAGIARYVEAYVTGFQEEMIHKAAGESMEVFGLETDENGNTNVYRYSRGENGEEVKTLVEADSAEAKATRGIHDAIARYADGTLDRAAFEEQMARINAEARDNGSKADLMIDNYLDLAEVAKERFDHEGRIENVMEGFRLINGEARRGVRSEAHRDALDRITNRLIEAKQRVPGLSWVPAEAIAVAASVATYVSQSTARTALRALIPGVGGAVAAGSLAAIRERNRVTGDRQTLARRLAAGESAGETGYDQAMAETMYEMKPATEYTQNLLSRIENVRQSNGTDRESVQALLNALAQAETAISMSDQTGGKGIDLISYSTGDTEVIERERLALDVARAQAKTLLGREALANNPSYAEALQAARETFEEDIDSKDRAFRSLRRRREAAQFTKSAVTSAVTMVASQEVVAAFSPDKYGVVDYLRGDANPGTSKTIMANLLKLKPQTAPQIELIPGTPVTEVVAQGAKMTDEQVAQYRANGYMVTPRTIPGETIETRTGVSAEDYALKYGTKIHHLKETGAGWANNGTVAVDGNEFNVYFGNNGTGDTFVTGMFGPSSLPNGTIIDVPQAIQDGKVSMYLYLSEETQGMPIKLNASMLGNGQLEFSAPNETIRQIIADRSYRFAEVVYDQGLNEDGIRQNITALATAVGPGISLGSTIEDVVTTVTPPETVYDVIQTITPQIEVEHVVEDVTDVMATMGIPFARRKELTLGEQPSAPAAPTPTGGGNGGGQGGGQNGGGNGGGQGGGNGGGQQPATVVRAGGSTGQTGQNGQGGQTGQTGQGGQGGQTTTDGAGGATVVRARTGQNGQTGQGGQSTTGGGASTTGGSTAGRSTAGGSNTGGSTTGGPQVRSIVMPGQRSQVFTGQQGGNNQGGIPRTGEGAPASTTGTPESTTGGAGGSTAGEGAPESTTSGGERQPAPESTIVRAPIEGAPESEGSEMTETSPEETPENAAEQIASLQEDIAELMDWPFDEEFEDAPNQTFRAAGDQLWWAARAQSKLVDLRSKNLISEEEYNRLFRDIETSRQTARQRVIEHYSQTMNIPEEQLTTPTLKRVGGGEDLTEPMSPADQMIQGQYRYLTEQRNEEGLGL